MVNAVRLITQVAITGTKILGRAFLDAYKQAAANSANQISSQSSKSSLGTEAANRATMKTGMNLEEATLILNIDKKKPLDMNEIKSRYDTIFKANDPANGGSFYIQSKVYRAKERLDLELEKPTE